MDKSAALAKFSQLLNELVAKQAKRPATGEVAPTRETEVEPALEEKGAMLKEAMEPEIPSEVEMPMEDSEIEEELEEDEIEEGLEEGLEEETSESLPPEIQEMLDRAIGKKGPTRHMRETSMGHIGQSGTVPIGGLSVMDIKVVKPKGRTKK